MIRKAFSKYYMSEQIDFEVSQASGYPHSKVLLDIVEHAFYA